MLAIVLVGFRGLQNENIIETVFSLSPRIVIASLTSYFLGELINASIIAATKIYFKGRIFAIRALFSTFIASFLESIMFAYIAFYGRMPHEELVKMIFMLTFLKILYEFLVMPFTIKLVAFLKKVEQIDVYEKPSLATILPKWD